MENIVKDYTQANYDPLILLSILISVPSVSKEAHEISDLVFGIISLNINY